MSHLKLKQIAGPSNGKQGSVIVFDNATPKWSTDLSTALQLPTGTTEQRPQTPSPGMMRFNSDLGAVEFNSGSEWKRLDPDLSIYLQRYVFRMEYTALMKVGAITELPNGWTVASQADTSFIINTGLGRPPAGGAMYGQEFPDGVAGPTTSYQYRAFNTSVEINYDTTTPNLFQIKGITAKTLIGTEASGHVYFHIYI